MEEVADPVFNQQVFPALTFGVRKESFRVLDQPPIWRKKLQLDPHKIGGPAPSSQKSLIPHKMDGEVELPKAGQLHHQSPHWPRWCR